jgi:hypothetical protein
MLTERFSRLFGRLLNRWVDYQDAPRDPVRVVELAAARMALDDVRSDIAAERRELVSAGSVVEGPRVAVSPAELSRLRVAGLGFEGSA